MSKTKKVHLTFIVFWCLMVVPTITVWKESILLVLLMSLYANIEGSITAYLTAKHGEENQVGKSDEGGA